LFFLGFIGRLTRAGFERAMSVQKILKDSYLINFISSRPPFCLIPKRVFQLQHIDKLRLIRTEVTEKNRRFCMIFSDQCDKLVSFDAADGPTEEAKGKFIIIVKGEFKVYGNIRLTGEKRRDWSDFLFFCIGRLVKTDDDDDGKPAMKVADNGHDNKAAADKFVGDDNDDDDDSEGERIEDGYDDGENDHGASQIKKSEEEAARLFSSSSVASTMKKQISGERLFENIPLFKLTAGKFFVIFSVFFVDRLLYR
jgi:hypothetical protein